MEDWHLGHNTADPYKSWMGVERNDIANQVVEMFAARPGDVKRRGAVTSHHYLESTRDNIRRYDHPDVIYAHEFAKLVWGVLRQAATCIPLKALFAKNCAGLEMLLSTLSSAFLTEENDYLPTFYEVVVGPPGSISTVIPAG